jgi:peptidoglycan/LPS O-acetylase OafA/YrhL
VSVRPAVGQIDDLNGLRGLLAVLVLLCHAQIVFAPLHAPLWDRPGGALVMGYRVPAFFALSGFGLYWSAAGREEVRLNLPWLALLRRRIARLYPAYLAALAVALAGKALLTVEGGQSVRDWAEACLPDLLAHVTLLHSWTPALDTHFTSVWWTLGYEFYLCLCIPALLAVVRRWGWGALFGFAAALLVASELLLRPLTGPGGGLFPPGLAFPFLAGLAAARLARRRGRSEPTGVFGLTWGRVALGAAVFGAASFLVLRAVAPPVQRPSSGDDLPAFQLFTLAEIGAGGAAASLCALLAWAPCSPLGRLLSCRSLLVLGRVSYSLFLIHSPVLVAAEAVARRLGLTGALLTLFCAAAVLVALAAAFWFHRWFEAPAAANRTLPAERAGRVRVAPT